MTKHEIILKLGITAEMFDKFSRRWFGEVVDTVPTFWAQQFIQFTRK